MSEQTATCQVVVARSAGLHARPALAIAETVGQYQSQVVVCSQEQKADASSVLQLLSLGAGKGRVLTLTAQGPDAEHVLEALRQLFQHDFYLDDK
ncbi:MAG: HPr family phosphocarrier protein [Candidatus Anammoximicrobium sp.]|nr:HPr family phosphocarrier protein [Candidatus Anammoximicrobium sp.]